MSTYISFQPKVLWFPKWVPKARERAPEAHKGSAVHNRGSCNVEGPLNSRSGDLDFRVGFYGAHSELDGPSPGNTNPFHAGLEK